MRQIILASMSPRRRELLGMLDIPFEVMVSETEEVVRSNDPAAVTEELSAQKAKAVASCMEEGLVIGADTVVSMDGVILGKPRDKKEAREMIQSLQGKSHMVYTGVSLVDKTKEGTRVRTFSEGTKVYVAPMTTEEVEAYIATEEPYDKAGAYGIQGKFGRHIEKIEGDYYNVVGLPVHRIYEELKRVDKNV